MKQAGSVVAPDYLRFDYSHFQAPEPQQLEQAEDLVNGWIRDNAAAETKVMKLADARKAGAVALFGEKYGDEVRVVSVHPESTELCGGTHVRRTGDIGLFKLTSESSIASGVRRITALTGLGALAYVRELEHEMKKAADLLKSTPKELVKRLEQNQKRVKDLERKAEQAEVRAQTGTVEEVMSLVRDIGGVKVLATRVDAADDKALRGLADRYRDKLQSGVVALGGEKDGKALILVAVTKDLVERGFSAGKLVSEMAKEVGGRGGGKADFAQAGFPDVTKIPLALEKIYELVKR